MYCICSMRTQTIYISLLKITCEAFIIVFFFITHISERRRVTFESKSSKVLQFDFPPHSSFCHIHIPDRPDFKSPALFDMSNPSMCVERGWKKLQCKAWEIWSTRPWLLMLKGFYTPRGFGLLQRKDESIGERIAGDVFGQNRLFYVLRCERFDDGRHAGLAPKDYLINFWQCQKS